MDTKNNQYAKDKNRSGCDMTHYLRSGIGITIAFLILFSLISSVQALKLPDEYGYNQCELIAKDYRDIFGGDLILIQPLQNNGAYELGEYTGHIINKAYSKNIGIYYIDYKSQTYFHGIDEIKAWYHMMTNKKSDVFNINQGGLPFAIHWHY